MFPLDLLVPMVFKAPLNYICILIYVPMFIPFQIWNFVGNSVSILLWCALGLLTFTLICVEGLFIFTWIGILLTFIWSIPDIWVIWIIVVVTSVTIGIIDWLTGGSYSFEHLGENAGIIELMIEFGPKEPEGPPGEHGPPPGAVKK